MRLRIKTLLYLFVGLILPGVSDAQTTTPFSKYGTIQTVQTYSSNPFWSPDAGYNQRMPQVVYATGPAVETSQCQIVVFSLITAHCAALDNCISTQLSDIRPTIMLQLSRMPGGNYATSCSGYIDTVFEEYKRDNTIAQPTPGAAFPTATVSNPNTNTYDDTATPTFQPQVPKWQQEMQDRRQELKDLQAANGNDVFEIAPGAEFPTTYADLSFTERMANKAAGYEPYKDMKAFTELKVESHETYLGRHEPATTAAPANTATASTDPEKQSTSYSQTPPLADNALDVMDDEILFYL